jgi:purine-binding chemotaxis protein CheW
MSVNASGVDSYVLFEIAGATYALPSDEIQQLEMVGQLTPVPNAPDFVDGVVSLRGQVLPVLNLRARFGFPRVPHDVRSRLVIVRAHGRTIGLLVDRAREFARIPADGIQPPPDTLGATSGRYLRGIAELGERMVLVLDTAELLNAQMNQTPDAVQPASAGMEVRR